MITVAQIGQVFVKATQFLYPHEVVVDRTGIRHDRDLALVEADSGFVPSDRHGAFFPLKFTFDAASDSLELEFPDGRHLRGPAQAVVAPLGSITPVCALSMSPRWKGRGARP